MKLEVEKELLLSKSLQEHSSTLQSILAKKKPGYRNKVGVMQQRKGQGGETIERKVKISRDKIGEIGRGKII